MSGAHTGGTGDFFEPVLGWRIWTRNAKRQVAEGAVVAEGATAAPASGHAPDYTEPVIGWRVWRVVRCRGQYLLGSLFNNVAWFPEAALDAHCFHAIARLRAHRSPSLTCRCGVHASRHEAIDWGLVCRRSPKPLVIGRVYLWGAVIEAEYGWRAGHAYPERIFVPRIRRRFSDADFQIAEGLERYRVPVERVHAESADALMPTLAALIGGEAASPA